MKDDERERAWLDECRKLDTRHITALTESVFYTGFDAGQARAEQLERELAAANERIKVLREEIFDLQLELQELYDSGDCG